MVVQDFQGQKETERKRERKKEKKKKKRKGKRSRARAPTIWNSGDANGICFGRYLI